MQPIRIVNLPKVQDPRGNLTYIEEENHIPFRIKRVYWIYDVPGGQKRGGHAFRKQQEFILALSGSFDVVVNNGEKEEKFHLNRSYYGLFVPNGIWRHLDNFSTNSVALLLSSLAYSEDDYIIEFDEYLRLVEIWK